MGAGRAEADLAQADHQVLPGRPDVRRADRVERAVRHGPAEQDGQQQGQRCGVAADQFGHATEDHHHPQGDPPAWSARHADGRHIGDDGRQIAVHRVGEGAVALGRQPGQRVPDGLRGALGHPPVDAEREAVREHRGEHAVGDPQAVAFDQALDREGERHGEYRHAGDQPGDGRQDGGDPLGVGRDVDLDAAGRRGRDARQDEQRDDPQHAGQEADQVGRAVRPGGEQRLVDVQVRGVVQRVGQRGRGRGGGRGRDLRRVRELDRRRRAVGGAVVGGGGGLEGRALDQGHFRRDRCIAGTCGHVGRGLVRVLVHAHVCRPGHLVLSSYHHSPPRRWWHAATSRAGQGAHRARRIPRTRPPNRPDGEECPR